MVRRKHIPQRMCVGCQVVRPKKELWRILRNVEGKIEFDPTGKKSGRGAYICPRVECLDKAISKGKLAKALATSIPAELVTELRARIAEWEGEIGGGQIE